MKKVIATPLKESFSNPDLGEMSVVALEPSAHEVRAASPESFPPTQNIFITRGYSSIGFKFSVGELVRLCNIEENRQYNDAPNKTKFIAKASSDRAFETVGQHEYAHVFEAPQDAIKRDGGVMVHVRPWRDFFIKLPDGDIYGPFYDGNPTPVGARYRVQLRALDTSPIEFTPKQTSWGIAHFRAGDIPQDTFLEIRYKVSDYETIDEIVLPQLSRLSRKAADWIDWIDDAALIDWTNKQLGSSDDSVSQRELLSALQTRLAGLGAQSNELAQLRLKRVSSLVAELELWSGQGPRLVSEFLTSTEEGKNRVSQFLSENKVEYLQRLEADAEDLRIEVEDLSEEKTALIDNIASLRGAASEATSVSPDEAKWLGLSDGEIAAKREELKKITLADSLREQLTILKYKTRQHEQDEQALESRVGELRELQNSLLSDVKSSQDQLRVKLRELKPYVDLLSGVVESTPRLESMRPPRPKRHSVRDPAKYVATIQTRLRDAGRDFRVEEVANLLVTVSQNFLTVFAGLPGVGKTSLVCHLANAMGMTQSEFLQIPVSRGWTSSRELLGYYNPLSQRFQASSTGLYPFLQQAGSLDKDIGQLPAWVLLDEANLSPIEHYWSTFVAMADSEANRVIRTGASNQNTTMSLPRSLRFLATINHDHTTEPLSPRLLDRAPVVFLSPPSSKEIFRLSALTKRQTILAESCVDWSDLAKALAGSNEIKFTQDEHKLYQKLYDALADSAEAGTRIIVSPRKAIAIARYVSAARPLMLNSHPLCALDFALSQYLLPTLSGRGKEFGARLNRVLESTPETSLPRTQTNLIRVIERGELDHHHYSFFSWM